MTGRSRVVVAALFLAMLMMVGCTSPDTPSEYASRPVTDFIVLTSRSPSELSIQAGGRRISVDLPASWNDGAQWKSIAPIDADRIAILADARLHILTREASWKEVPVGESCSSAVSDGRRIAVLCAESRGRSVVVHLFDDALREIDNVRIHRLEERSSPDDGGLADVDSGAMLLASGRSYVWIGYQDRHGFARGGSRLIAKHRWAGSRQGR